LDVLAATEAARSAGVARIHLYRLIDKCGLRRG
jgi:hypothetical protein